MKNMNEQSDTKQENSREKLKRCRCRMGASHVAYASILKACREWSSYKLGATVLKIDKFNILV
jgi:hypothetical protein